MQVTYEVVSVLYIVQIRCRIGGDTHAVWGTDKVDRKRAPSPSNEGLS